MELIHNRDGFYCGVCVCGLGGVYVGCGWGRKLMLPWAKFLQNKTEVQLPHKLLVFEMFSNGLVGQVCDWKKLIPKARMYS